MGVQTVQDVTLPQVLHAQIADMAMEIRDVRYDTDFEIAEL